MMRDSLANQLRNWKGNPMPDETKPTPEPGTAFPPSKGPPPEPVGPPQEAE